jgi:ribosome-associated protein
MEDMSPGIDYQALAGSLAELLQEHKGQNVSILDLRKFNIWTDFFIIATVTSNTHMEGLERHVKEFCHEREADIFGKSRKGQDDQWRLIDLGSIIIHLMTSSAREFYDLERLWNN